MLKPLVAGHHYCSVYNISPSNTDMSQGIDICYGNQIHCRLVYTIMHVTNALIIKYYLTISVPVMCVHYYNTIQTVNLQYVQRHQEKLDIFQNIIFK